MGTELPQQRGMWLMPIIPRNLHSKYELNIIKDKEVVEASLWLPWQMSYHG